MWHVHRKKGFARQYFKTVLVDKNRNNLPEKYIKIQENVESYYTKGQVKSKEDQNKKTHKECMQTLALEDLPFMISALKKNTFSKQNVDIE